MYGFIEVNKKIEIKRFYSFFSKNLSENYVFSGESHNFWEVLYVEEGDLCVIADGRVYHLTKGDIIFHKPMELHKFHVEKSRPARIFVMSFALSGPEVKKLENVTATLSEHQKKILGRLFAFLADIEEKKPFNDFIGLFETHDITHAVSSLSEFFLLSITDEKASALASSSSPNAMLFKKAVRFMEDNVDYWLSIDEIAKHLSISSSYLKKIFLKYAGLGVHKYFLKLKIIRASSLLGKGMSVTEVSDELSFSSQNYFSIVFKRETGTSPLAYKKDLAD